MTEESFEQAVRLAPIVYMDGGEPNLPTNVDWFLARTALSFCDGSGGALRLERVLASPSQTDLLGQVRTTATHVAVRSDGTRSDRKRCTFYLEDLPPDQRIGSRNPSDWTTYVHAYPNVLGGTTLQYWRFHAYNTGFGIKPPFPLPPGIEIGFHGGDWEGASIDLDASGNPRTVHFLGHTGIEDVPWNEVQKEDGRPVVYCERGGHASKPRGDQGGIRWETHGEANGARVSLPGSGPVPGGRLLDVGSKTSPLNGQAFIQYSGLWGSPSGFPLLGSDPYYWSSGYWGPAFNETAMAGDGFVTAWGKGAADPQMQVGGVREYYANDRSA